VNCGACQTVQRIVLVRHPEAAGGFFDLDFLGASLSYLPLKSFLGAIEAVSLKARKSRELLPSNGKLALTH